LLKKTALAYALAVFLRRVYLASGLNFHLFVTAVALGTNSTLHDESTTQKKPP
jgi:hypothetical protein